MSDVLAHLVFDSIGFRTADGDTIGHDKAAGPVWLPSGEFDRLADLGAVYADGDEPPVAAAAPVAQTVGEPIMDVDEQAPAPVEAAGGDLGKLTVAELKQRADELGVQYPSRATKADLVGLLAAAAAPGDDEE